MLVAPDVEARFWPKVHKGKDCWEWMASCSGNGYGAFKIRGRQWGAHQVSYLIHHGSPSPGMVIMHTCDNPRCVNPDHLRLGTYADNSQDRDRKFRRKRASADHRGEANPKARISEATAIEIIAALRENTNCAAVARDFGLAYHIVKDIHLGRSWVHIER